jgi:hypothetical protein
VDLRIAVHTLDLHTMTWLESSHWDGEEVKSLPTPSPPPRKASASSTSSTTKALLNEEEEVKEMMQKRVRVSYALTQQFGAMGTVATCGNRSIWRSSVTGTLLYVDQFKEQWCRIRLPLHIQPNQIQIKSATLSPLT